MNRLLWQIEESLPKTAPGVKENTIDAINLCLAKLKYQYKKNSKSYDEAKLRVLNIGSGKGLETIWMLQEFKFAVAALDAHEPYLDALYSLCEKEGFEDRIELYCEDMNDLPFKKGFFDIIICEGSINLVGFKNGVSYFKKFLKPGGMLVVSDYNLTKTDMPKELTRYFETFAPDINLLEDRVKWCESEGLKVHATLKVPDEAWWKNYLSPMRAKSNELLQEYEMDQDKLKLINELLLDLNMREKYKEYYEFNFIIMQKK